MDQILEMAKELGEALQQDERFIRVQMAQTAADQDEELQKMIGEFNLQRMAISNESGKDDRYEEKLSKIMDNASMQAYNNAKPALEALVGKVSRIITLSAQGEDPYAEETENGGCTGSCASCGGCH